MTDQNYTAFVRTVESTSWHQPNERLLHAAMGLCTESAELIETIGLEHTVEELGDVLWYLALAFDSVGLSFEEAEIIPLDTFADKARGQEFLETMSIYTTDVLDLVKKQIFYGREIDILKLEDSLNMIKNAMHWLLMIEGAAFENKSLYDIAQTNERKLRTRYPEKFSEEAAINRDVKAEYDAMKA